MPDDKIAEEYEDLYIKYKLAQRVIEVKLFNLLDDYKLCHEGYNPVDHTKSRIKELKSAVKKLKKKGIEVTPENLEQYINDMVGVRIVCPFVSDVYEVVNQIRKLDYQITEESDYIQHPKPSGYRSYHIDVSVPVIFKEQKQFVTAEIQVRTMAMDLWATLDHRLRYKLSDDINEKLSSEFNARSSDIERFDTRMDCLMKEVEEMKREEQVEEEHPVVLVKKINRD